MPERTYDDRGYRRIPSTGWTEYRFEGRYFQMRGLGPDTEAALEKHAVETILREREEVVDG